MLCEHCSYWICGRRYCESCIEQDEALFEAMRKDLFHPAEKKSAETVAAPQKISELPLALKTMFTNSAAFFVTAKEAPFGLTYMMAFLALIPTSVVRFMVQPDTMAVDGRLKPMVEMLASMPTSVLVASAILFCALQILLLDLILWACIRFFTASDMTYTQTGSMLHFCLVPLVLGVFGSWLNMPFISFVGLGCMIVLTGTGIRNASKCGLFQELGVILSFTILGTLGELLP